LAYLTINKLKIGLFKFLSLILLLIYGTGVKYQAIFIMPILAFWLSYCFCAYKLSLKSITIGIALIITCYSSIKFLEYSTRTVARNSWQYVKLYDLVGIASKKNDDSVLPAFTKNKNYDFQQLKSMYEVSLAIDNMAFNEDAILRIGRNKEEMDELYSTWKNTVIKNLDYYLPHRYRLLKITLEDTNIKLPENYINKSETVNGILNFLSSLGILSLVINFSKLKLFVPLSFMYLLIGGYCIKNNIGKYGIPLFAFNLIALSYISCLLFMTMAATFRYVYLSTCLIHASHIYGILCCVALAKSSKFINFQPALEKV
jgi:hypothetical protein